MSLLTLLSLLLLLSGCNDEAENNAQNFDLVASEKTLPENMHELAFERKETPHYQYLVKKADNQLDFEKLWNLYEFENQAPKLHFDKKDTYFIGVHESGSCPSEIEKVESNSDNTTITIAHPDGACTTDATPRTFVIQIDNEESKNIESVIIIEGNTETSVPIEN